MSQVKTLVKMKCERAKILKIYWFPPNSWFIARWWRFEIWEINFISK